MSRQKMHKAHAKKLNSLMYSNVLKRPRTTRKDPVMKDPRGSHLALQSERFLEGHILGSNARMHAEGSGPSPACRRLVVQLQLLNRLGPTPRHILHFIQANAPLFAKVP